MFSQLLKLIPRHDLQRLVKQTGAESRSKGLSSWSQFVAMLFGQLGRAHSWREIEGGLKSCEGKVVHLSIAAPARSSLSYSNAHRLWEMFEQVFYGLLKTVTTKVSGTQKFRFKNKLVSLDATVIDLCLSLFDWAKFRRTKGAGKFQALDVSEFKHYRFNHSKLFADTHNHIIGIENFWNQAKRHLRKYNGIPKHHFPRFLKECEWRFNYGSPKQLKTILRHWVKLANQS